MDLLQSLIAYKSWADDLVLSRLERQPEAVLEGPRSIVFGSLIRTLHHAYLMDVVWQCHLRGEPHGLTTRNPREHPAIGDLAASQRRIDRWYVDYLDSLSPAGLGEAVAFEFIGGGAGALSREQILVHVANHATYHRGHMAAMLYDSGVVPPTTDYPVFLRTAWVRPGVQADVA